MDMNEERNAFFYDADYNAEWNSVWQASMRVEKPGPATVYFDNLEDALVARIEEADMVFGCVAWLCNARILDALAKKECVQIIVQQEDFLRPDTRAGVQRYSRRAYRNYIKTKYEALPSGPFVGGGDGFSEIRHIDERSDWRITSTRVHIRKTYFCDSSACCFPKERCASLYDCQRMPSVLCCGTNNTEKNLSFPRMHHKFLIFAKERLPEEAQSPKNEQHWLNFGVPYAVWTGSFNMSKNATRSNENGLYVEDETLASAYMREWGALAVISEPPDWDTSWKPNMRRFCET